MGSIATSLLLVTLAAFAGAAQAPEKARKSQPDRTETFSGTIVTAEAPALAGASASGVVPIALRKGDRTRWFVVAVEATSELPKTSAREDGADLDGDALRSALASPGRSATVVYDVAPYSGSEAHFAREVAFGDPPPKLPEAKGLEVEELEAGSGPGAERGDWVTVHYTGWLKDGRQFQSSRDSGRPFRFKLGAGTVIKGWDYGIVGMRVGGKRRLTVAQYLAYGARGSGGNIPPYAGLVFEIDLLRIDAPGR